MKKAAEGISKKSCEKFKEKFEVLLGVGRVKAEYARHIRHLDLKFSDLAEKLEGINFEIENLRPNCPKIGFRGFLPKRKKRRGEPLAYGGKPRNFTFSFINYKKTTASSAFDLIFPSGHVFDQLKIAVLSAIGTSFFLASSISTRVFFRA